MTIPTTFTLTLEDYQALVALARKGVTSDDQSRQLELFLISIEKQNNVLRFSAWVQWQELEQALPPTTKFPEQWPPELRRRIDILNRPIARSDVQAVLDQYAKKPTNVMITTDPAAQVGWTPIDVFFP